MALLAIERAHHCEARGRIHQASTWRRLVGPRGCGRAGDDGEPYDAAGVDCGGSDDGLVGAGRYMVERAPGSDGAADAVIVVVPGRVHHERELDLEVSVLTPGLCG